MPMKFLHCSDVHITADYPALPFFKLGWRRWVAMLELSLGGRGEAYRSAGESLSAIVARGEAAQVDHFIVSGDLTAYALESEFQGAAEALGRLISDEKRLTVIPGNHDVYTPGSRRSRRFERHFGHLLQSDLPEYCTDGAFPFVRLLDGAAVVGLSSLHVPPIPGLSMGVIGKRQLHGLRLMLQDEKLAGRAVLVAVHHAPLLSTGKRDSILHGLWDAKALMKLLPGSRFAVLHGHVHRRYHHPPTAERPHIFGAGSSTEKDHEGFWLIQAEGGQIRGGEKVSLYVGARLGSFGAAEP
jgi:3',5'-cyclic AMP phosphodiesterase CpdA